MTINRTEMENPEWPIVPVIAGEDVPVDPARTQAAQIVMGGVERAKRDVGMDEVQRALSMSFIPVEGRTPEDYLQGYAASST